ncbi:MAG: replicative DNA helicase [Elusimicrobia bacterium]|nr:replicative DNA helicase [Elusimicrobiota bacterium]
MANNPAQLPPQALEAESAVLGSMLIERDAAEKAIDSLAEKDFYLDANRKIFAALKSISERGDGVDVVTAAEELKRRKLLDEVGGMAALTDLVHKVATAAHIDYYARLVKEKSVLRELITTATAVVSACFNEAKEPTEILDEAQASILRVAERQTMHGVVEAKDLAHEVIEQIELAHSRKQAVTGVPSGLKDFDRLTTGFQKSDLILIAARPSQGKTALALNIASHVVLSDNPLPVLVFSMEMSKHAIMERFIAADARVNLQQVRTGFFPRDKWTDLTNAAARFSEAPLYIVDRPGLSVLTVRSLARQLTAELRRKGKSLGLVVIDYLQLMRGSSFRSESRQQEVSDISRGLKHLARDLNVPVIALSQLSRRPEEKGRPDGRPQLSDLRDSGALEQDADLVAFIFREGYYKRNDPTLENKAEIIIAKQRQGPTGVVEAKFYHQFTRFVDADPTGETEAGPPPAEVEETQTTFP